MMPRAGSPILRGLWMVTLPLSGGAGNPVMSAGDVEAWPGVPGSEGASGVARGRVDGPVAGGHVGGAPAGQMVTAW